VKRGNTNLATVRVGGKTLRASATCSEMDACEALAQKAAAAQFAEWQPELWTDWQPPEKFGSGSLVDAVLKLVRDATSLDIVRADIKVDMLTPHFFMNFRVVDEHGRQLGQGRNLGALKAEWGKQARGASSGPSVPEAAAVWA
jgi:hypothetical protein